MAKVKKKPTNAGGKREGAGQFSPFGEKTQVASYRVPISKIEIFDSAATAMLEQWKIKDGEGIKAKVDKAIEAGEITVVNLNEKPVEGSRVLESIGVIFSDSNKKFLPSDEEIKQEARENNAETKCLDLDGIDVVCSCEKLNEGFVVPEGQDVMLFGTADALEKMKDAVFVHSEEPTPQPEIIVYDSENEKGVEAVFPKEEQEPEKDHAEPRYSEAFIESLLDTAKKKYKTGKIIKEVGTNEEYRLAYGLDFDRESDNIVMGGTSIEKGIYKSRVVLFSNDEWAKF